LSRFLSPIKIGTYRLEQLILREDQHFRYLDFLRQSQYWPESRLKSFVSLRLKSLISHAYQTVPYYRRLYDAHGIDVRSIKLPSDLQKIPAVSSDDIRSSGKEMISSLYPMSVLQAKPTSGSTGKPRVLYQTRDFKLWKRAFLRRQYEWLGYSLGDRVAVLWGSEFYFRMKNFRDKLENALLNHVELNTFRITEDMIRSYAQSLANFHPQFIESYMSAVYLLAKIVRRHGIMGIHPRAIMTTSEILFPNIRKFIEDTFGCPVFDRYGANEVDGISLECPAGTGMHINLEGNFLEFVGKKGPVDENEVGEIVITNLYNYGMPLIRYRIGDYASFSNGTCRCGKTLPLMGNLHGRIHDFIVSSDGSLLDPYFFVKIISPTSVQEFKIDQENAGEVTILVKTDSFEHDSQQILQKILWLDPSMKVRFKRLDSWPISVSGKYRFVESKAKIDWY